MMHFLLLVWRSEFALALVDASCNAVVKGKRQKTTCNQKTFDSTRGMNAHSSEKCRIQVREVSDGTLASGPGNTGEDL